VYICLMMIEAVNLLMFESIKLNTHGLIWNHSDGWKRRLKRLEPIIRWCSKVLNLTVPHWKKDFYETFFVRNLKRFSNWFQISKPFLSLAWHLFFSVEY
jgi:hypothetical protein